MDNRFVADRFRLNCSGHPLNKAEVDVMFTIADSEEWAHTVVMRGDKPKQEKKKPKKGVKK